MLLRDRIFTETGSFLLGCMIWIPLAIWVISLVRWMVSGEVDVVLGLPGILLGVVIGYVALVPPAPIFSAIAFVVVCSTVIMYPFMSKAMTTRSLKSIDMEDLERAYHALQLRPDNWAAKFKIATLLYNMGYPGHALRIAEACIATMPQTFFVEEHRQVMRWRMTPTHPKAFDPISCIECGQSNPPGNVHCAACGSPFLLDRIRGKLLPSTLGKKLLAAWIVMVAVIAGLPLVASLGGAGAVLGIVALLVLACGVLYLAFRSPDKGVAV
ncbi:MAG TPA: zinc ribbon domain-containing protein [Fimbriimonas sp.]|nr:zinc ribbon domain-containing protein [Fimbriimonas sp.]